MSCIYNLTFKLSMMPMALDTRKLYKIVYQDAISWNEHIFEILLDYCLFTCKDFITFLWFVVFNRQVNTLVHFGDDNMIRPSPGEFLVAEPYLGIPGEVEYHELSHCLFISGQGTMFKGEVEAIVNFPFAHVSVQC